MALRIEAEVRKRVEAALASPEVQARIEARLREERAALEQKARQQWGVRANLEYRVPQQGTPAQGARRAGRRRCVIGGVSGLMGSGSRGKVHRRMKGQRRGCPERRHTPVE